jgi:hypothetical protein
MTEEEKVTKEIRMLIDIFDAIFSGRYGMTIERGNFEDWANRYYGGIMDLTIKGDSPYNYENDETQLCWETWQGRGEQSQKDNSKEAEKNYQRSLKYMEIVDKYVDLLLKVK